MQSLFLGVDGGGSGCRARLADAGGAILGEGMAGPANPRFDPDHAVEAVENAARDALAAAGLPVSRLADVYAGLGLAGVGQRRERDRVVARPHPFAGRVLETDAYVACLGAHSGDDGAVIVVGTGSCGQALIDGRAIRIGGWGFPVSDQGSGAWLGLEGLRVALAARDWLCEPTSLTEAILGRYNNDPEAVVAWLDGARPRDYAVLAPIVVAHAAAGDQVGIALMRQAASDLSKMASYLLSKGAPRLSLLGGLAAAMEPWLTDSVRAKLTAPLGDALDGALLLARRAAAAEL